MTEFGSKYVPGQSIDRRLLNEQFDQSVVYDDDFIQLEEKPPFSQEVTYEDELLFIGDYFNNKIISKSHNYTQDYFELRAQQAQGTTTYTFENGLTESNYVVTFGGSLNQDTTLDLNNQPLHQVPLMYV